MRRAAGLWAVLLLLTSACAHADEPRADRVGDAYELRLRRISETDGDRSRSSSQSNYTLIERVVAVRDEGLELEFDLPSSATAEAREQVWQYPARVFVAQGRERELLNRAELQTRVSEWLQRAQIPETACGRWIFTWTAIKIECDPDSVLEYLEAFDLRSHPPIDAVEQIDPDLVRREQAESDVAVAEMMGEPPMSLEVALQARAVEQISGTITTRYELNRSGQIMRRTIIAEVQTVDANGARERTITTTTLDRRRISP